MCNKMCNKSKTKQNHSTILMHCCYSEFHVQLCTTIRQHRESVRAQHIFGVDI